LEKMFDTVKIIKAPTPCLYTYNNCTIVVYVDDLIINGPNVKEVTELKNIIKGLFVCTDAGAMKEYLGVLFERRDDGAFVLSQRQYLLNVLQRFGMEYCKPCTNRACPRKRLMNQVLPLVTQHFHSARRSAVCSISQLTLVLTSLIHGWNAGSCHGCTKCSRCCRCQATNALPFWNA
jgi:Reverse transcriptase (RNA-dependent DNA polymerase)